MLLIEVIPNLDQGCIIYFSLINDENSSKARKNIFFHYTFEYSSIDDLLDCCITLFEKFGFKICKSSLHKNKNSKKYYLTLTVIEDKNKEIISFLKEFSMFLSKERYIQYYINEHFELIIKNNALEVLYNNFK